MAAVTHGVTTEELTKADKERIQYYTENPAARKNPMGGRYQVLPAGDEIVPVDTARDTGEGFVDRVMHALASAAGITYEQFTGRWDKLNYSAARGALLEIYKDFRRDQEGFAKGFLRPWVLAVLDEGFARGYLETPEGAPEFWDMPAAYCRFKPVLPPRGWVDQVKEVQAAGMRINLDLSTLEEECAEQGRDWKEVLAQRAREHREYERLGIPLPNFETAMSTNAREDKSEGRRREEDNQDDA